MEKSYSMCIAPLSGIRGASPAAPSNPRWHDLGYLWHGVELQQKNVKNDMAFGILELNIKFGIWEREM